MSYSSYYNTSYTPRLFKSMKKQPLLPRLQKPKLHNNIMSRKRPQSIPPTLSSSTTLTSDDNHQIISTKRSKLNSMIPSWNIGESIDSLMEIPLFHVSPFTSLMVDIYSHTTNNERTPNITPNTIASKILQVVSLLNATGEYNSEKACATIHTIDGITLSIQMFKSIDCQSILIDIERKVGNTIQFHYVANTILKEVGLLSNNSSIRNDILKPTCELTLDQPPSYKSSNDCQTTQYENENISSLDKIDNDRYKFQQSMEQICTLIQKDRFDAIVLGLESLESMTNGISSNDDITALTVQAIIVDDEWHLVRDFILDLFQEYDENIINVIKEDMKLHNMEFDYRQQMKQLTLRIISNCLSYIIRHHSIYLRQILNEKLSGKDVSSSQFIAATCMNELMSSSEEYDMLSFNSFRVLSGYQNRDKPSLHQVLIILAEVLRQC